MTKILTTRNAEITTASVQVKTLTISGKQVTQSVFRQLREEALISDDGTLNGVPWGYVNYHPDKCEQSSIKHLHVVWQSGVELFRSAVALVPDFDRSHVMFSLESGHRFFTACVRSHLHGEKVDYFGGEPIVMVKSRYYSDRMEPQQDRNPLDHEVPVWMRMSDKAFKAAGARADLARACVLAEKERASGDSNDFHRRRAAEYATDFADALKALDEACASDGPLDRLFKEYDAEARAEMERRKRHRGARAALAELPHLFIAV